MNCCGLLAEHVMNLLGSTIKSPKRLSSIENGRGAMISLPPNAGGPLGWPFLGGRKLYDGSQEASPGRRW
jgi:hypothetical protein